MLLVYWLDLRLLGSAGETWLFGRKSHVFDITYARHARQSAIEAVLSARSDSSCLGHRRCSHCKGLQVTVRLNSPVIRDT